MYVLKLFSKDMEAEVSVNDVQVAQVTGAELSETVEFIPQWLADSNALSLRISGPGPFQQGNPGFADGKGEALAERIELGRVRSEVIRLPDGFRSGEAQGTVVAVAEWRFDPAAGPPVFPVTITIPFNATAPGMMNWQRSRLPLPSAETRADLLRWLKQLRGALEDGQTRWVMEQIALSLDDLCRAMGIDPGAQRRDMMEFLTDAIPVADLLPITEGQLATRSQAGGKLLLCKRPDGQDMITTRPGSPIPFALHVRVGNVDGSWRLF